MNPIKIKDFHAGTTLRFSFTLNDYPNTDFETFFVLQKALINKRIFTYANDLNPSVYDVNTNSQATSEFEKGNYKVTLVVRSLPDAETQLVEYIDCGFVNIKEDVLSAVVSDITSDNQKMLNKINQALLDCVSDGFATLSMNGKTFQKYNLSDLNALKVDYEQRIAEDLKREELLKYGKTNRNKLKIIYSRHM